MNTPPLLSRPVLDEYERGLSEAAQGNLLEAASILEGVLADATESMVASVCNDLGVIRQRLGDIHRAVECFRRGLHSEPDNGRLWINLARCLKMLGQAGESLHAGRRAAALSDDPPALMHAADFLARFDLFTESEGALLKAIERGGASAAAWTNLGNMLSAQGRIREGLIAYGRALELEPHFPAADSNRLFALHLDDELSPENIAEAHFRWGAGVPDRIPPAFRFTGWDRAGARPLRVGILASDLRTHSIVYFLAPLLENREPAWGPLTVFSNVLSPDETTAKLRAMGHRWFDVSRDTRDECAARIHRERIDILIEAGGHTSPKTLEVLARRPSPVQIAYLAYPDTTGLRTVDYLLTDGVADPPGVSEHLYTERLLRLPDCLLCYRPPEESPDVAWQDGGSEVVFGSCAQRQKLSGRTLSLWASILRDTPRSRLLLKSRAWKDPSLAGGIRRWFETHGVDPSRVETVSHIGPLREHLAFYDRIDICLDTYPYSGITTTCEALWMGAPVIALPGRNQVSRICASILHAAGLAELIAGGDSDYVTRAVELAGDRARLRHYRTTLRQRVAASPLMNGPAFARSVEMWLREVWREWAGAPRSPGEIRV